MTPNILAPRHIEAALAALLRNDERLTVREMDYGRLVELRLDAPDAAYRRRSLSLILDFDLARNMNLRSFFRCAIERLRAHLDSHPPTPWVQVLRGDSETMLYMNQGRPEPSVPADTVPVLIEFAKAGKRQDFEWLARSAGVQEAQLEELWRGTLARVAPR